MRVVGDFYQAAPECAVELEPGAPVPEWATLEGWEPRYCMTSVPCCPPGWSAVYSYDTEHHDWLITLGDDAPRFVSLGRYLSARQAEVMLSGWAALELGARAQWDGAPRSNPVVAWWPL